MQTPVEPLANANFEFDNVGLVADSVSTTTTYAYNAANELTKTTYGAVDTNYAYDAWGRESSKWMQDHSGRIRTSTATSSRPSRPPSRTKARRWRACIAYNYDGVGRRRVDAVNGQTNATLEGCSMYMAEA